LEITGAAKTLGVYEAPDEPVTGPAPVDGPSEVLDVESRWGDDRVNDLIGRMHCGVTPAGSTCASG
jgi:hypothetical protein